MYGSAVTRSPVLNRPATAAPTATTSPENSCPMMVPGESGRMPPLPSVSSVAWRSEPQIPQSRTARTSSAGPGSGSGTTSMASGLPTPRKTAARMARVLCPPAHGLGRARGHDHAASAAVAADDGLALLQRHPGGFVNRASSHGLLLAPQGSRAGGGIRSLTPPGGGFGPPSAVTWRLHGDKGSMGVCPASGSGLRRRARSRLDAMDEGTLRMAVAAREE